MQEPPNVGIVAGVGREAAQEVQRGMQWRIDRWGGVKLI